MPGLSFVTLLAYDYRYSYAAIRSYYEVADEIVLGIDAERRTWMQAPFDIDMTELQAFIDSIDRDHKIRIIEGNFHSTDQPMLNETIERIALSKEATAGNWIVQIDCDEYLLNAPAFRQWLSTGDYTGKNLFAQWIGVFKAFGNQVLVIDPATETVPVATHSQGAYLHARRTGEPGLMSPLQLLHYSWGRSPQEVMTKLKNWGHAKDFDVQKFFRFWQSVTLDNYMYCRDFHPLNGPIWPALKLHTLDFSPVANAIEASEVAQS